MTYNALEVYQAGKDLEEFLFVEAKIKQEFEDWIALSLLKELNCVFKNWSNLCKSNELMKVLLKWREMLKSW
jgi:hypothetical protein